MQSPVHTLDRGVSRIKESPRVTKPYTEEQWANIESLGHKIDVELEKNDARLTMGGEPTFISIDNMDGEEWNFTAVGPEKRRFSAKLIQRLKDKFAPNGLLHFGQGKWYPGESLPRWALACYWRKDGHPMWHDSSLFAEDDKDYGHNETHALRFIQQFSRIMGVQARHVMPAYEDLYYLMWRENRLPTNVNPGDSRLDNKEERVRIARLFDQGLSKVIGYVLPIRRNFDSSPGWTSGAWFFKSGHLFLTQGDSPIGLRLPLESMPWVSKSDFPWIYPLDPGIKLPDLPSIPSRIEAGAIALTPEELEIEAAKEALERKSSESESAASTSDRPPKQGESADWVVRTAICVEPRQGKLHIFMPPVSTMEDYLDLIAAVENTAASLKMPVVVEGSPPPDDCRLNNIKVTPDPGVIEVNLHPSSNWKELAYNTTTLYEEARQSRLGTEKFMLDGRHTGTGGGNHIVLGGATPSDSPFLRRPDLLRSLVSYWQNHPSLSFLFSGLFIGPTSQHPRIDEARNDSLYEMELAFKQIPKEAHLQPWLIDRIFRNLLVDSTGNTHRSEFCIDKLYSPDSSTGRLGLLEMRAFEMPPHSRMSLAQQLLLRGLVAWFWKQPYEQKLVRWGTSLHDKFMLPHFVESDFQDVISNLREAGLEFEPEWFAPHIEFRFPHFGNIALRGLEMEVRQALEPWHVLGEKGAAGGAVRYVDSSVERLQLKVKGMTDSRHLLACNGRALPLHPTGVQGEYIAGVRYRAWQPPECLHPTIGVDAPLIFDLVDRWNQRSIGGCTYHVTHPGGLSYTDFPVNAYEAESRRLSRFFKIGHTPGLMKLADPVITPEMPMTLDLRNA